MTHKLPRRIRCVRRIALPAIVLAIFVLSFGSYAVDEPAPPSPSLELTKLGKQFYGAGSCSAAFCHGSTSPFPRKNVLGNEYLVWHDKNDPHRKAYKTLLDTNAKSKAIADALKIPSARASERCLNCHATLATGPGNKSLKGPQYSVFEGVSCNSCHGPAQDYIAVHPSQDWIDQQRAAMTHEQILAKFGRYDTLPLLERAERCVSCHLAIDPDLVAAGHPQPTFEMNFFSTEEPRRMIYPDRHWKEPDDSSPAGLWAAGQLAELHDAMLQLYSYSLYKVPIAPPQLTRAYNQAMAHYAVFHALFDTKAVESPDMALIDADVKKLQASLTDMKSFGEAALAAADHCKSPGLRAAITKFRKPDTATVRKIVAAVAKLDLGKLYMTNGVQQQVYAIFALCRTPGLEDVNAAIQPVCPTKAGQTPDAMELGKALQDVRTKIGS